MTPEASTLTYSALALSGRIGVNICHTRMRRKGAKKSMELADESVRGVVRLTTKRDRFIQGIRAMQLKNVELLKLGHRIRRARKLLGFSQKGFSAKCGFDRSYFGDVERGNRNVTFGVLCTICEGLTCDIAAVTKGIPHADRRESSGVLHSQSASDVESSLRSIMN